MNSKQADPGECKHCGNPLRENDLGRVCHACMMSAALAADGDDDVDVDTALPEPGQLAPNAGRQPAQDLLEGSSLGQDGRYKILQRIGEGGFGLVYMAEQTAPVRRRVAVKVLKAGMDTRQLVARFEAERQALAMMDHPNIAKVLDGGETEQGRPFFVMELVRGTPITTYCDREQLDPGTRLGLFMQVCGAVQHAHQKGIIHRDLKPSNILITAPDGAEPVPKVIDFGVAKALESNLTDKTLYMRFEQMIGTPAYMSPEQAGTEGGIDVDTRADIYALGVLLYELLTGTTPFEANTLQGAAFEEVRRILREEEVPRPSARLSSLEIERRTTIAKERDTEAGGLGKLLRGDLDWIVMKAIEKDRRRRYDTANALAADVERHLANEPVSAGPPTAAYRTGKFLRRHKVSLAVAAAMVLLLVVGIAATSWQAIRATAEQRRTAAEKDRALGAEELAEERRKEAEAISDFLSSMFESAQPGAEGGGRTITLIESIKIAEKKLEDDEEISANRRAKLQHTIAAVYSSLGSYNAAITIMEKYRDPYLEGDGTDDEHMIEALSGLATYYSDSRRHGDALELRERVLTSSRERLGSDHPETLTALHTLAMSYEQFGRSEEARAMTEEALAKSRTINGPEHDSTLSMLFALYGYYNGQEGLEKSIELLEIFNRVHGAEHPMSLYAMDRVAHSLRDVGRVEESVTMCEELLDLRRKVIGSNHPDTLGVMNDLSFRYAQSGRLEEAIEIGEELVELARRALGPDHQDTLTSIENLSGHYNRIGKLGEALELKRPLLASRRRILGSEHSSTLLAMNDLGTLYAKIGSMEEAVALLEEALTLRKKVTGLENPATLLTMQNLGACYAKIGSNDRAITLLEESLLLRKKVLGPKHPDTLHSMHELAVFYSVAGLQDKALVMNEEVWELMGYLPLNADSPAATSVLIEPTSTWCWIHPVDGVDPMETVPDFHRTFFNADYDDASWQTGKDGEGTSGYLGTFLTAEVRGVRMKSVMVDSPAARGGLLARDLIRMLDGEPFADLPAFRAVLAAKNPGDQVILSVVRGDESKELTVTLGSWPDRVGFGYGDEWFEGVDIGTPNEKALGKSAYLRHRFTTEREHTNLELRCRRDDGIIVYLDGVEVARGNMSDGEEAYRLPAKSSVGDHGERAVFRHPLGDLVLPAGEHVLAISLHNHAEPSSDLRIGGITLVVVE